MNRGVVAGVFWGALAALVGLVVLSEVAMPPSVPVQQATAPAEVSAPKTQDAVAPDVKADSALAPQPARTATEPAPAGAQPSAVTEAPAAPGAAAEVGAAPAAPAAGEPLPGPATMAPGPRVPAADLAPAAPDAPAPQVQSEPSKDALLEPAPAPPSDAAPKMPAVAAEPAPAVQPAPTTTPPQPEAAPKESTTATIQDNKPSTLPSAKALPKVATGVTVNQLPQVGAPPVTAPTPAAAGPLALYARSFEGGKGKPLFAILLRDIGAAGMDRAELARLPFPVSFVVDPLAPDAEQAEQAYRAAGQEVLILATGIPAGATAADIEQTFQSVTETLPETVAMIDATEAGFQDNRPLASLVIPVLKAGGRGLVTYDRGLNAADQIARREGLPAATIFRRLDAEGEAKAVIRRYLDRAAFKAAQDGKVVVIGDTRPETIAALLEWTVEGRAASVALAPVSAVLSAD